MAVEETVFLKFANGKIAEEWGVLDFAALQQQLEAAAEGQL
jgi:predicted ester cyclase